MFKHVTILLLLLIVAPAIATADDRRPPNIIFIMADDLGYGHLGCYGQELIRTPRLDRMAAEGMRFTQCYAGAPVCASSRCVLMTGYHGGHTPVRGNTGGIPLPDESVTVAEILREAGYATGLFGKWGLGEHGTQGVPYKQGFDEFFGYLHQIHAHFYYPEYLWDNDQKFSLDGNTPNSRKTYTHDVIVERALDFVRENRQQPFFMYVPFAVPHYELLVPEDSLAEYRGRFPETPYTGRGRKAGYPHDYAATETPRAAIAGMITRMDGNVGRLLDLLGELDLDENTYVFFTSDNGPSKGPGDPDFFDANGPLRGYKSDVWEGGLRVPTIIRAPGRIAASTTSDHACYFADVLPTLADLAETASPEGIDGLSFAPALLGKQQPEHELLYWEHDDSRMRAVRVGDWKAVIPAEGHDVELYNLADDMGEEHNVARAHPEVLERLSALLESEHNPAPPQIEPERPADRNYQ